MLRGALTRRRGGRGLIACTAALGASVATALLGVVFDIGDKVSAELSTYGANIVVQPKGAAVVLDLYGDDQLAASPTAALREDEVAGVKTIFWAFNVVAFSPFLETEVAVDGVDRPVGLVGSWFSRRLELPSGEQTQAGLIDLRSWWRLEGAWIADQDIGSALVGTDLAASQGWSLGDRVTVRGQSDQAVLVIAGLIDSGGDEDGQIVVPLAVAQSLSGRPGQVDRIEVAALTTPDNDLARRAARNPASLTVSEWETWYCTAYASSIAYQIEEVMTDAVAKPQRQITESQGAILNKTSAIMVLVSLLALAASALAIANLVTAQVMERSAEIGLLKAVGATDGAVVRLILAELTLVGLAGGMVGYGLGLGLSQAIGWTVFDSAITPRPAVAVLVALGVAAVVLTASLPSIRLLLRLRPADVLHGR
ncbi:MAG: ABC transporter permease [Propionibacteriaceae bacterium]|nr:ABC transporter permease [Propionibacteriaceae bacterium]